MRRRLKTKAQTATEYAIIIGVVIGTAIAMQTYIKRGLQGRVKQEVVEMALDTKDLGTTGQYEPYYMDSSFTTTTSKDQRVTTGSAKSPTRTDDTAMTQKGIQKILAPVENE